MRMPCLVTEELSSGFEKSRAAFAKRVWVERNQSKHSEEKTKGGCIVLGANATREQILKEMIT